MFRELDFAFFPGGEALPPLSYDHRKQDEGSTTKKVKTLSKPLSKNMQAYSKQYRETEKHGSMESRIRRQIFGTKLIASAHNRGQKKDMKLYANSQSPMGNKQIIEHIAKRKKIQAGQKTALHPYTEGNCLGGTFSFSKKWLSLPKRDRNLKNLTSIAQEFEEGIPKEGIILQGVYERFESANLSKEEKITPQKTLDIQVATAAYGGLVISQCPIEDGSPLEVLEFIEEAKDGAYGVGLPLYSSTGSIEGYHQVAFIKVDGKLSILYDSNFGTGYEDTGHPKEMIKKLIEYYTGPLSEKKTASEKMRNAARRTWNFFSGEANSPLFKELKSGFSIYRFEDPTLNKESIDLDKIETEELDLEDF